jgi:hypothetical protein
LYNKKEGQRKPTPFPNLNELKLRY